MVLGGHIEDARDTDKPAGLLDSVSNLLRSRPRPLDRIGGQQKGIVGIPAKRGGLAAIGLFVGVIILLEKLELRIVL